MIDEGVTWVAVADGARLRIFEEKRRAGPLVERPDEAMRQAGSDRPHAAPPPGTTHQRVGPGRHAGERENPAQAAETRFLGRVLERLDAAARRGDFDRLVLVAPPTALGVLRAGLTPLLAARLAGSDPHERTRDDAEAMRGHLRRLRALA